MLRKRDSGIPIDAATEIEGLPSSPFASPVNTVFDRAAATGGAGTPWMRGQVLDGRYRLEQSIRLDPVAQLFLATQLAVSRQVVVAVLRPEWARDADVRQELERTALALAAIDHGGLARVLDLSLNDPPYVVLEHVAGRTLAEVIAEEGPLEPTRAIRIAMQLCGALGAGHGRGLVHGDLRAANIVVCQREDSGETPRLVGFVLADARDTVFDSAYGLGDESALELACTNERRGDARADLYALACVLHQMLTGTLELGRKLDREALFSQLRSKLDLISAALLCQVVERGIARAPVLRFQSADKLEEALRRVLSPKRKSEPRLPTRRRAALRFVVLSLAAIATSGLLGFWCAHGRTDGVHTSPAAASGGPRGTGCTMSGSD